jgi:hypothetical protein
VLAIAEMVIDPWHLWMAQRGEHANLAIECVGGLDGLFDTQSAQCDLFDDHVAPGLQIARAIDCAETAKAEDCAELVAIVQQCLVLDFPVLHAGCQELSAGETVCMPLFVGCPAHRAETCRNHRDRHPSGARRQTAMFPRNIAQEEVAV